MSNRQFEVQMKNAVSSNNAEIIKYYLMAKSPTLARKMVFKKYPNADIICIYPVKFSK